MVMGYSDLMLREGPLDSYQREWLEIIFKSSQRITSVVRDLLSVARMQPSNLRLNPRSLSLNLVVDEVLDLVAQHNSNHECAVEIGLDVPEVVADQSMLSRVLEQLLDNAIKFSPEGARVIVSARHKPERRRVVVAVSDQGVGIAPEDHDQIFDHFRRLHRPETEHIRGAGLGLSGIPQIKPPFLDIAPAGIPPNIIPHSKSVKCGLMRPDSLKFPAFMGQPLYCQA